MQALNLLSLSERRLPDTRLLTNLSRFQRILMVTDGTVTELLEQYLAEKIKVLKLYEKIEEKIEQITASHSDYVESNDLPVLKRDILLQGQSTKNNWIYAESTILLNHLNKGFRTDLLNSREPIGRLWEKYRYETYKVILSFDKRKVGTLAGHFNISPESDVISRTYSVYSGGKIIMIITEVFPDTFFCA